MRAALIVQGKGLSLEEVPQPAIGQNEMLVKMEACGVCGTDLEKQRGEATTPPILGHEVSGAVVEVGADVSEFAVDDRVVVHHHEPCGACGYCISGSETMCEDFPRHNLDPCGFAEYFRVPAVLVKRSAAHVIPEELSFEEATFAEPLGCCIRSLTKLGIRQNSTALVLGAGPMGLLLIQLSRTMGVSTVFAADISPYRLGYAQRFGAQPINLASDSVDAVSQATGGEGVDLTVVATGNVDAVNQALAVTRKGGIVNLFGMPPRQASLLIKPNAVFMREIRLVPSYSTTAAEIRDALVLLKTERIRVEEMITDRFSLSEIDKAFQVAGDVSQSVKVIVTR